MGKIHTHYDNLKVARMAPQEVIRAAYKALSQKYHPDKNPGDEKAARIMAILNSAYGTLSDPQRRKEHDEWIAAEEWEIEWLESTRHEDSRDSHGRPRHEAPQQAWGTEDEEPRLPRRRRNWRWWTSLALCLALGWAAGVSMVGTPQLLATVLASAWGDKAEGAGGDDAAMRAPRVPGKLAARPEARADARTEALDSWAVAHPYQAEAANVRPAPIKVMALSQIVLPGSTADCEGATPAASAPNGEAWPVQSGYVDGFPVAAKGDDMQLLLDNSSNPSAVFIKVYDMDRHANVRYVFVLARDKLVVDKLLSGKYEIRYQNIDLGAGCPPPKPTTTASNG
ncbi:J domain-containing protein [Rugamonas apoptosis]|uniref:J domain-containing protein n=1 Tax=Rugamonas apoptosis TaxID=2758570 RepID=A0A7W2F5Q8_9BURK|nr:J domain-containing protein [Rugamonas apoptosis]MBA5685660.1 J domain-containing protein [Rugamonas apoptosis]